MVIKIDTNPTGYQWNIWSQGYVCWQLPQALFREKWEMLSVLRSGQLMNGVGRSCRKIIVAEDIGRDGQI
jgi:hypothetical protein